MLLQIVLNSAMPREVSNEADARSKERHLWLRPRLHRPESFREHLDEQLQRSAQWQCKVPSTAAARALPTRAHPWGMLQKA